MKVSLKYILNHFNQPIKVIFEFKDLNKICAENDSKSSHKGSLTTGHEVCEPCFFCLKLH